MLGRQGSETKPGKGQGDSAVLIFWFRFSLSKSILTGSCWHCFAHDGK